MRDIIILADELQNNGMYVLHMMSNQPFERSVPENAQVERSMEAGAHTLKATWKYRGPCVIRCDEYDWKRVVVLWGLEKGDRISEQAVKAAKMFWETFGEWPIALRLPKLPNGVELGTLVELPIGELVTTDSDFVPDGFLAVDYPGVILFFDYAGKAPAPLRTE